MRILFLTYDLTDHEDVGEIRVVLETIKALAKYNIEIFIITNYCKLLEPLPPNVRIYRIPFSKRSINFPIPVMMKAFIYSLPIIFLKKIQVIHLISTNAPSPYHFFKFKPFVMSADKGWDYENLQFGNDLKYDRVKKQEESGLNINKSIISKMWSKFSFSFFSLFKLNDILPKNVDLYICRSKYLEEELKSKKYNSQLLFLPHAVDCSAFYPKKIQKNSDTITFIFVGRISKRKGVEYLIKSFNKLSDKYKNVKLLLVGKGAESTLDELKKLKMERIEFVGEVAPQKINDYYNQADVFVLPSLGEPSSLTTLEAMASGKPIISTRGGVDDFFKEKEMGFWIEPANIEELYKAMEKFVLDPKIIKPMGEKSRAHVLANYTWDKVAEKLIEAYKPLI